MSDLEEPRKRLKFSRLCLPQSQNAVVNRNNTQVPNSQISRFFSNPKIKDDSQRTPKVETSKTIDSIETGEHSDHASNHCNETKPATTDEMNLKTDEIQPNTTKQSTKRSTKTQIRSDTMANNDTKSTIKSFFSNENNDSMSDFEIPTKVVKKVPKTLKPTTKTSKTSRRKQPDIRKALNKRDVSSKDYHLLSEEAQLELALAMSKAEASKTDTSSHPFSLEAFEYKAVNAKGDENFSNFFNVPKRKNARFKWNSKCTQLTRRNNDLQKEKVRKKVDELLVNNIIVESRQTQCAPEPNLFTLPDYSSYEIFSKRLQRVCVSERILFEINGCPDHSKENILSYYTNNLVERSDLRAGVLLRDWSKIPGRDSMYDSCTNASDKSDTENMENQIESMEIENPKTDDVPVISSQSEQMDDCVVDNRTAANECLEPMESMEQDQQTEEIEENRDDRECEQNQYCQDVDQNQDADGIEKDLNPELVENSQIIPVENEYHGSADSSDDEDVTFVMDSSDIQSKVDEINSKIRLSQSSEFFEPAVLTYDAGQRSPDLFDDDDDIFMVEDDEMQTNNNQKSPISTIDEETIEAKSSDVILISSNSNSVSNRSTQNSTPYSDRNWNKVIDTAVEIIDLIDSDSENMLKENIDSPKRTPEYEMIESTSKNDNDEDIDNDRIVNSSPVFAKKSDQSSISAKTAEPSSMFAKKLSFTERLELFEKDMLNGFTADIPDELLTQSQNPMQSQESIELSDDEINYSMRNGAKNVIHVDDDDENEGDVHLDDDHLGDDHLDDDHLGDDLQDNDHQDNDHQDDGDGDLDKNTGNENDIVYTNDNIIWTNGFNTEDDFIWANDVNMNDDDNYMQSNPMEFHFRDSSSNLETEANLVDKSVCNIFEKTFETHNYSPVIDVVKQKSFGSKSFKKVNSESVLRSHYDNPVPSTSKLTPAKHDRKVEYESPIKLNSSPFSQPTQEIRMDLSNDEYHIRTGSVTPKPNYEEMDTIAIEMELRKYGLKPSLRRRQAIICLEYIYNRTHPFIENVDNIDDPRKEPPIEESNEPVDDQTNDPQINFNVGFTACNLTDAQFKRHSEEKIFLPSNLRAKKPWCLEPLHIAWHNLIKANPELRKAVLLYMPINLVELKKFFKTIDMTFDNRDLIAFLDLHCITFRTNRNTKE